jgi:formylmethanofuran dehydrogenase subunit E
MEDEYSQNDEEFKKINKNEPEEENEEEEDRNESDEEDEDENIKLYNKQEFELENIINFFFNKVIFEKVKFCPKCGNQMKLENNKNYLDEKVWRCRSKIFVHDEKKKLEKIPCSKM